MSSIVRWVCCVVLLCFFIVAGCNHLKTIGMRYLHDNRATTRWTTGSGGGLRKYWPNKFDVFFINGFKIFAIATCNWYRPCCFRFFFFKFSYGESHHSNGHCQIAIWDSKKLINSKYDLMAPNSICFVQTNLCSINETLCTKRNWSGLFTWRKKMERPSTTTMKKRVSNYKLAVT